jgi:hypothetical protein
MTGRGKGFVANFLIFALPVCAVHAADLTSRHLPLLKVAARRRRDAPLENSNRPKSPEAAPCRRSILGPRSIARALFERSSIMSDIEEAIRRRAYELWENAGMPHGRSDEFWHAARSEFGAEETMEEKIDELGPPIVEPPVIAVQHGAPVGLPGERIVDQGVIDDRIEDLLIPSRPRRVDD